MRGTSRSCVAHGRRGRHRPRRQAERRQRRLERRAVGVPDDERAGAELAPGRLELLFRRLHLHVRVLEAERHEVVVGGVIDDQHRPGPLDAAGRLDVGGRPPPSADRARSCRSIGLITRLRMYWNVQPVSSYGRGLRRRVVLHREVHVGDRPIRLVAADDVVARLDVDAAGLERGRRGVELEALPAQLVDRVGRVGLPLLRRRDHPAVDRTGLALSRPRACSSASSSRDRSPCSSRRD